MRKALLRVHVSAHFFGVAFLNPESCFLFEMPLIADERIIQVLVERGNDLR